MNININRKSTMHAKSIVLTSIPFLVLKQALRDLGKYFVLPIESVQYK